MVLSYTFRFYKRFTDIDTARYLPGAIVYMLNESFYGDQVLFLHEFYNSIGSCETILVTCQLFRSNWYDRIYECDIDRQEHMHYRDTHSTFMTIERSY